MSIEKDKNSYAECRYSGCRYAERRGAPEPHHGDAIVGVLLDEERLSKLVGVGDSPGGKVTQFFFLFLRPFFQNKLECSVKIKLSILKMLHLKVFHKVVFTLWQLLL
jgi:hypothetical protein